MYFQLPCTAWSNSHLDLAIFFNSYCTEYAGVELIHLHSITNLFRYDENIVFVKKELLPIIDSIRNDLARKVGAKWKDLLQVR